MPETVVIPDGEEAALDMLADLARSQAPPGALAERVGDALVVRWDERDCACAFVRTPDRTGFARISLNVGPVTSAMLVRSSQVGLSYHLMGRSKVPVERDAAWHALREIMGGVDPAMMLAASLSGRHDAYDTLASHRPHARQRQEFAVAHPWLSDLCLDHPPGALPPAIAAGDHDGTAVTHVLGMLGTGHPRDAAERIVERFRGQRRVPGPCRGSLRVLAALPGDVMHAGGRHPAVEVAEYAHFVAALAEATGRSPLAALGHVPGKGYGDWIVRRAGDTRGDMRLGVALHGLTCMLLAFRSEVLQTARAALGEPPLPMVSDCLVTGHAGVYNLPRLARGLLSWAGPGTRILARDMTAPALLELSARWHARSTAIGRVTASLMHVALPARPLTPDVELGGDVYLTCLADVASLLDEGSPGPDATGTRGLAHCVSSYAPRVLRGRTHVLSLRRRLPGGGFERLSTAEVCLRGTVPVIAQHRGHRNSDPDRDVDARLRRWFEAEGPALLAQVPGPMAWPEATPLAEGVTGRPDLWCGIRDAWAFALPRPLRAAGPAEVLAYGGEAGLAASR